MAKAANWPRPDTEARRRGEQTGLDTRVVHAVNDAYPVCGPAFTVGACLKLTR